MNDAIDDLLFSTAASSDSGRTRGTAAWTQE